MNRIKQFKEFWEAVEQCAKGVWRIMIITITVYIFVQVASGNWDIALLIEFLKHIKF